ncbi:MAG: type II toxin-antitoxin system RelE/ParE family toxin [Selenomonadaceae bacterium]|nr:type II toxin-antitoxin system RelE/ParE family toxin [Selenomonadaceae bacterium]
MNVRFYETADGKFPALEFIESQSNKMQSKIARAMDMLELFGVQLKMPHSEYLGDGIFQLRAQSEGNAARVLYFFVFGDEAILTNGFIKKTPKTPTSELELTKRYYADFLKRKEGSE